MYPLQSASAGLGLEWLPVVSILAPIALLLLLVWYGSRNTV